MQLFLLLVHSPTFDGNVHIKYLTYNFKKINNGRVMIKGNFYLALGAGSGRDRDELKYTGLI